MCMTTATLAPPEIKLYKNGLREKEFGKNTESHDDRGGKEPPDLPPSNPCAKPHCLGQAAQESTQELNLNISREGDSTTSLGSLFQGSVTFKVKKFFLTFRWNFHFVPAISGSVTGHY